MEGIMSLTFAHISKEKQVVLALMLLQVWVVVLSSINQKHSYYKMFHVTEINRILLFYFFSVGLKKFNPYNSLRPKNSSFSIWRAYEKKN
jgi:hypothetical protein